MKDRILNALMLLAVAAALIVTLARPPRESEASAPPLSDVAAQPTPHPAEAYRTARQSQRQEEQNQLRFLLESDSLPESAQTLAESMLRELVQNSETELAVEAVLAARGYPQALCVCRKGKVTLLSDRALQEADAALISDLVQECAAIDSQNIRISTY